jgi:hypothetical protein
MRERRGIRAAIFDEDTLPPIWAAWHRYDMPQLGDDNARLGLQKALKLA